MAFVIKKFLGVFKSKFFLVPVILVALAGLGAGVAFVTTNSSARADDSPSAKAPPQPTKNPYSDSAGTLGVATGSADGITPTPSSSTTKPKPSSGLSSSQNSSGSSSGSTTDPTSPPAACDEQQKDNYYTAYQAAVADLSDPSSANYISDPGQLQTATNNLYTAYVSQLTSINCTP